MSVNYVALGKRIGYFRMQCGNITQEALASKINRSREFLAKIEKGTEHPSVATLVDIADALCISVREGNHPEGNERPDHQAAGRLEGPAEGSYQAGKEVSRGGEVKPTSGQVGPRVYAGLCPAPQSSKDI